MRSHSGGGCMVVSPSVLLHMHCIASCRPSSSLHCTLHTVGRSGGNATLVYQNNGGKIFVQEHDRIWFVSDLRKDGIARCLAHEAWPSVRLLLVLVRKQGKGWYFCSHAVWDPLPWSLPRSTTQSHSGRGCIVVSSAVLFTMPR